MRTLRTEPQPRYTDAQRLATDAAAALGVSVTVNAYYILRAIRI